MFAGRSDPQNENNFLAEWIDSRVRLLPLPCLFSVKKNGMHLGHAPTGDSLANNKATAFLHPGNEFVMLLSLMKRIITEDIKFLFLANFELCNIYWSVHESFFWINHRG